MRRDDWLDLLGAIIWIAMFVLAMFVVIHFLVKWW